MLLLHPSSLIPHPLFQNLSGLHGPEHQIKLVEIHTHVARECTQLLFRLQITSARGGWFGRVRHAKLAEATQDMLIQNGVAAKTYVAQKVAGFLVAEPLDAPLAGQPVAPLYRISETDQPLSEPHPAIFAQVVARGDDIARTCRRVTMSACLNERSRHLFAR